MCFFSLCAVTTSVCWRIGIQINRLQRAADVCQTAWRICQSVKGISALDSLRSQSETGLQQWACSFCWAYESTPFRVHWFQGDTVSLPSRIRIFTYSSKNSIEFYSFLALSSWWVFLTERFFPIFIFFPDFEPCLGLFAFIFNAFFWLVFPRLCWL